MGEDGIKRFKDLNIPGILSGKKVRMDDILNTRIIITKVQFRDSKFHEAKYAKIQFRYPDSEETFVVFTESENIHEQLQNPNIEFPFLTRIKKFGKSVCFT